MQEGEGDREEGIRRRLDKPFNLNGGGGARVTHALEPAAERRGCVCIVFMHDPRGHRTRLLSHPVRTVYAPPPPLRDIWLIYNCYPIVPA